MDMDEIFSVKQAFWLGKYKTAIKEADKLSPSSDRQTIDNKVFKFRSHLALGDYSTVLSQVSTDDSNDLQLVKMFASILQSPEKKTEILGQVNELLSDQTFRDNTTMKLLGSIIYDHVGDFNQAYTIISSSTSVTLEMQAMKVNLLLKHGRFDLAKQELKSMQAKDEDSTLTQKASGWVNLSLGGELVQEAVYIFQELLEKSLSDDDDDSSSSLINALAASQMRIGSFESAMKTIQRGLKYVGVKVTAGSIDWGSVDGSVPGHLELLWNFICCGYHLNKVSLLNLFLEKLQEEASKPNVHNDVINKNLKALVQLNA